MGDLERATEAMVLGLATFTEDPDAARRQERVYARWVAKSAAGLTSTDAQSSAWLTQILPGPRNVPARILGTHRLLPGTQTVEEVRAPFRPFELPYMLADIHTAATRGREVAARAMVGFDEAFEVVGAHVRVVAPESAALEEFADLTGSRQLLDTWIRPGPFVDLGAITEHRTLARREVRRLTWRLDWQSQMAVLRFVRDAVSVAPQLVQQMDELAREGVRLALSGMAEAVATPMTATQALAVSGGGRANPFPARLADAAQWQALRLWKYRPSPFVLALEQGHDQEAADAVLRAGARVVSETITVGALDPRVRPVYGAVVRRLRQDLREDRPLAERLVEFPAPVCSRILQSASPSDPGRPAASSPGRSRPGEGATPADASGLGGARTGAGSGAEGGQAGDPDVVDRGADRKASEAEGGRGAGAGRQQAATEQAAGGPPAPGEPAEPAPDPVDAALATLDALIGLEAVKLQIRQVAALARVNARRVEAGLPAVPVGYHMLLTGNPGTGKTTVARMIGELFGALGVLRKGHLVEAAPADFIAQYVGGTEKKTKALLERAAGGVLFIDEAYNLTTDHPMDYGHDAVAMLVAKMENSRDDLVVLAAGYSHEMHEFLDTNPGLRSRFSYTLPFPDLDDSALNSVFLGFAQRDGFQLDGEAAAAIGRAIGRLPRGPGFGNAREIRKLYEQSVVRQAARVLDGGPEALLTMLAEDIPGGEPLGGATLESVGAELDALVGLDQVKSEIRTMGNVARLARVRRDRGLAVRDEPVGHMVFTGNPGTGKTTVARLMGRMLNSVGALPRSDVLTVTRGDLVGEYIGQTAPKTRKAFERALGGVLFIDEAYSLMPQDAARDFGHEALATLMPLMEEHRKHIVVVMAGYPEEMEHLLDANPGMRSRIRRTIEFPDYSPEELAEIVKARLRERDFILTPEADEALLVLMQRMPRDQTFGNARTAGAVMVEILERQANRLASIPTNRLVRELDRLQASDIPAPAGGDRPRFGFA